MTSAEFEICYYDRLTKHEHIARGYTSLIPAEIFQDRFSAAMTSVIDAVRDRPLPVHELGAPYPETVVEPSNPSNPL